MSKRPTKEEERPHILVVIDMQADFLTGALKNPDAEAIVPGIVEEIKTGGYDRVYFTKDRHGEDYLTTNEGMHLQIPHCIAGTPGYQLDPRLVDAAFEALPQEPGGDRKVCIFTKQTFGSPDLARWIALEKPQSVTLVGTCTDICVIANFFLIKTELATNGVHDADVFLVPKLCAGTSKAKHDAAIAVMESCHGITAASAAERLAREKGGR
jgi:nicotinamidase-related amidase